MASICSANQNTTRNTISLLSSIFVHLSMLTIFILLKQDDSQLKKNSITINATNFITMPTTKPTTKELQKINKQNQNKQFKLPTQKLSAVQNKQQETKNFKLQKEVKNIEIEPMSQIALPQQKDITPPAIELWKIKEALYKNIYFPTIAIKLKQTGTVLITFTILPNREVAEIEVIKSSGYDLLDNAAVKTVKNSIKDFPETASSQKITVPIEYKLN